MSILGFRHASFLPRVALLLVALLIRPPASVANDVTPPAPPPPRPPIVGFVDTHLHQFANLGFGGMELWGSPMDPALDAGADLDAARRRALPDSDFIYVSAAEALDYLYIGDVPVITTPLADVCTSGSCWPGCPPGTGTADNACVRITVHGPDGSADLLNGLIPNGSGGHGVLGYPDMNGWPAHDVLTAQQAYWEWLQRAHAHGLKLVVMLAVNNSVLCKLALHRASFGCDDDSSVSRQIQGAKDLEGYIDARAGGPGQGFYRIVYSSAEAREAIAAGKLAVVLGTEVDTSWGCTPGAPFCTDSYIQSQVQSYHDLGIRVVYPVHLIDNRFGGAALYTALFEIENFIVNGSWFDMAACSAPIEWRSDIRQVISDAQVGVGVAIGALLALGPLALPVLPVLDAAALTLLSVMPLLTLMLPLLGPLFGTVATLLAIPGIGGLTLAIVGSVLIFSAPGAVGSSTDGNCNNRGLTAEGQTLINALMDHQMLIDVDHTDTPTFDAILDIAEARNYPGIVSGHTGLVGASLSRDEITGMGLTFHPSDSGRHEANKTDPQVQRVLEVGGFVSLGLAGSAGRSGLRDFSASDAIAFDCGKSSQSFAQQYLYATQHLGLAAVGFGSDFNGFPGWNAPRFGPKACRGDFAPGYDPNRLAGRLDYATATDYFGAPLPAHTFGNRTWDYNLDGFAHVGLYPDFIADLKTLGLTDAQLAPLFSAAEAFVRMWEKVDDEEAPIWRCGTVGEAWHADDVTVPCLSYDFGWGLADPADANFSLSTTVADGTETGNASTGTHATICDNDGHCTGVIPAIAGINVDKKAPSVTVTTPPAGTPTYTLNAIVPADYGCVDGGSGVASCAGPVPAASHLDTSIGPHEFTVTGSDHVANTASVAHPYNVSFAVCLQFDNTRAYRAGSTVPVKLRLCDASGANVSSHDITLTATGVVQVSTSTAGVLEDAGQSNPDHQFRHTASGDAYEFNLKTTGFATGTYALTFTATGDPIPHEVLIQIR